jgi:hypothetical protein
VPGFSLAHLQIGPVKHRRGANKLTHIFGFSGDNMSDQNKAILLRHFEEVLNQGKLDVVDEIYSDDYVLDAPVQTEGSAKAHG